MDNGWVDEDADVMKKVRALVKQMLVVLPQRHRLASFLGLARTTRNDAINIVTTTLRHTTVARTNLTSKTSRKRQAGLQRRECRRKQSLLLCRQAHAPSSLLAGRGHKLGRQGPRGRHLGDPPHKVHQLQVIHVPQQPWHHGCQSTPMSFHSHTLLRTSLQHAVGDGGQQGPEKGVPMSLVTQRDAQVGTLLGREGGEVVEQAAAQGVERVTGHAMLQRGQKSQRFGQRRRIGRGQQQVPTAPWVEVRCAARVHVVST